MNSVGQPQHDASSLICIPIIIPTRPPLMILKGKRSFGPIVFSPTWVIQVSIAFPPSFHILRDFTNALISPHRFKSLDLQVPPHICLLAGTWPLPQLCLSVQSKVLQGIQQSTCKVYGHAQHMFLQFCHYYGLLLVPANQETLLCFATFLADAKGLQHGTILRYL